MTENKMERFFNTTGPVRKEKHYCIDPLTRVDLNGILSLIHREKYFVLHAPRQTGKTTLLKTLMDYLNNEDHYKTLHVNLETAQAARGNVEKGIRTVLRVLANESFIYLQDSFLKERWKQILEESGEFYALQDALMQWCQSEKKPIVLFLDEVDSLVGDTLISLLRQLRSGYDKRPTLFPQGIVLCGIRDVRDYRMHSDLEQTRGYMDKCGTGEGYLLIFNRSPKASWEEKIFQQEQTHKRIKIKIYGM